MAISSPDYNAVQVLGNTGTSTNAITPTVISGWTNNVTRVFVLAAHTHTYGSTPSGWSSLFTNLAIGSALGAAAAGGGQRFLSLFYRDKTSSWSSMPSFAMSSVANGTHALASFGLDKSSADHVWDSPTYTATPGVDTTANTAFATGNTSNFVTHVGSMLMAAVVNNDGATFTPSGYTHSGTTATLLERGDLGSTTGFDVGLSYLTGIPSASSGANNPFTLSGTHSAATQGGVVFFEQTESAPPAGAAISTLTDAFPTDGLLGSQWTVTGGTCFVSGGLGFAAGASSFASTNVYDLTNGYASWQMSQRPTGGVGGAIMAVVDGILNYRGWFYDASTDLLQPISGLSGVGSTLARTPYIGLRIRHSGSTIYWDYNTGSGWTNHYSESAAGVDRIDRVKLGFQNNDSSNSLGIDNVNLTPVFPTPGDPISDLVETFNPGTAPGGWAEANGNTADWTFDGQLSIKYGTNSTLTTGEYVELHEPNGSDGWNLEGDSVYCEVVTPAVVSGGVGGAVIGVLGHFLYLPYSDGNIYYGETQSGGAYDAAAQISHRWMKISESGGTVTYWSSPDGATWTSRHTEPFYGNTASPFVVGVTYLGGASRTFRIDNINTLGLATNAGAFFQLF